MKKLKINELINKLRTVFQNLLINIKKNPKKSILTALTVVFAVIFLSSAIFLVHYFVNSHKQNKQNDELANIVEQLQQGMQSGSNTDNNLDIDPENPLLNNNNIYAEVTNPETGEVMDVLKEYSTVYLMNTDMVGWIKIPGTKVNYPVLQSKEPNYYLRRDFYKQSARHGSIYANELADFNAPSDNITIYGHNMGDKSMFGNLQAYENIEFYKEHPYIIFDTLKTHQVYKVIYAFYVDFSKTNFAYHEFVDGDEFDFSLFIAECKDLALYDTGDTAVYGNKLLTLSTCDNNVMDDNIRFVVVAKKTSL